jgi:hypothetical protein
MTHLVNDRPPNLLDDLGIAVAHLADGTPVDRDPVGQLVHAALEIMQARDPSSWQARRTHRRAITGAIQIHAI